MAETRASNGRDALPVIALGAAVLLVVVALVASYLPARRATRISPMLALRSD